MKTQSELVRAADENFVASFRNWPSTFLEARRARRRRSSPSPASRCRSSTAASSPNTRHRRSWEPPWHGWRSERCRFGPGSRRGSCPTCARCPWRTGSSSTPGSSRAWSSIRSRCPHAAGRVTVVPILAASLDEFLGVLEDGGLSPALARRLISPSLAADPDVQLFVGRLDGTPVGTSIAIRSRDASGVYNVGRFRVPAGAASAPRSRGPRSRRTAWGHDTVVLQSSSMGLPLYSGLGFRTVAPYVVFRKSSDACPATRVGMGRPTRSSGDLAGTAPSARRDGGVRRPVCAAGTS